MTDFSMAAGSARVSAAAPCAAPSVSSADLENALHASGAEAAPAPARPLHKQLAFTLFMTGGMVSLMSLYNTALHTWFSFGLLDWACALLLRWPLAFAASLTVGDFIASRVIDPIVRRFASPNGWIASHMKPFCKVNAMVPVMTLAASLLSVGFSGDLLPLWAFTYVTTLPVALAANVAVVGPAARKLYKLVFGERF